MFFDLIIEDDSGEMEEPEEVVPYQLSQEAIVMDMKVQDIKVCCHQSQTSCSSFILPYCVCVQTTNILPYIMQMAHYLIRDY